MSFTSRKFFVRGMECGACEKIIERTASKIKGVKSVKIDYVSGEGRVTFDKTKTSLKKIFDKIEENGYDCERYASRKKTRDVKPILLTFGAAAILLGAYFLLEQRLDFALPELDQNASVMLLFIVGVLTGFHCIAMCGGFVVSYTAKSAKDGRGIDLRPHLTYGVAKTISYTVIGAAFGFAGSFFTFTPMMRGAVAILAGIFLVMFGLNMLDLFTWFRRVRIVLPEGLEKKINPAGTKNRSPLAVGLLNGLMIACGPLQAIYILAAASGSAYYGALYLAAFGLGTLPVLLGFGVMASFVSARFTQKILRFSGTLVILLGVIMLNRGLALTGTGYDLNTLAVSLSAGGIASAAASEQSAIELDSEGFQVVRMNVTRYGWEPDKFLLKKGVPVRWVVDGKEVTYCNNAIQVPKLGLNFDVKEGEQVIEFTPESEGVIPWSCWMGMIPGVFIVREDIDVNDAAQVQAELEKVSVPRGGSCGGSCGNPSCGAARGGGCGCGGRR